MVYEQVLTILFALAVGVAIIAYAAKPRQRSVPASIVAPVAVASFSPAPVQSVPVQHVTVEETPVFAESPAPVDELTYPNATPAVAEEIAPTLSNETTAPPVTTTTAIADTAFSGIAAPVAIAAESVGPEATTSSSLETTTVAAPAVSSKPRRTSRRKSTTTRRSRSKSPSTTTVEEISA